MSNFLKRLLRGVSIALVSFLVITLTFESQGWSAACDDVILSKSEIRARKMLEPQHLKKNIALLQKNGWSPTKAKGVAGEWETKRFFEEGPLGVVSLVTFFKTRGCDMTPIFHNGAGHGIDDIFVYLTQDGQHIDRRHKPIFVEAKYSEDCRIKLAKTKTICTQLSKVWLDFHLDALDKRILNISMGDSLWRFKTKGKSFTCSDAFLNEVNWLRNQINSDFYSRKASLLCPDGYLVIYDVDSVLPTVH